MAGDTGGPTVPRVGDADRIAANARVSRLAAKQHGLVTVDQLRVCGLGRGAIDHRRRIGWLQPVAPRVFAVGRPPEHPLARHVAALLSVGRPAWLSHGSAAVIWRLAAPRAGDAVDLVVVGCPPRPRPGVRIHQTKQLDIVDRAIRNGIPVTSVARTLVDVAALVTSAELERMMAEAFALHRCAPDDVRGALDRAPVRDGRRAVRELLAQADGPRRTRSVAERRLLAVLRAAGIEPPRTNVRVAGIEVDAVWLAERVIVEVDGYAFHGSRRRFEHDRRRDARLQAAGWVVFRVTWRGLTDDSLATVARLSTLLAARRRQAA